MLSSNAVQVHDSLAGQALAHGKRRSVLGLELGSADEASLFELDKAVADVLSCGLAGVFSLGATVGLAAVVFAESEGAHLLSHVELVGNGGRAGVEPVVVIGSQLTEASGLNILGPLNTHSQTAQ